MNSQAATIKKNRVNSSRNLPEDLNKNIQEADNLIEDILDLHARFGSQCAILSKANQLNITSTAQAHHFAHKDDLTLFCTCGTGVDTPIELTEHILEAYIESI